MDVWSIDLQRWSMQRACDAATAADGECEKLERVAIGCHAPALEPIEARLARGENRDTEECDDGLSYPDLLARDGRKGAPLVAAARLLAGRGRR